MRSDEHEPTALERLVREAWSQSSSEPIWQPISKENQLGDLEVVLGAWAISYLAWQGSGVLLRAVGLMPDIFKNLQ